MVLLVAAALTFYHQCTHGRNQQQHAESRNRTISDGDDGQYTNPHTQLKSETYLLSKSTSSSSSSAGRTPQTLSQQFDKARRTSAQVYEQAVGRCVVMSPQTTAMDSTSENSNNNDDEYHEHSSLNVPVVAQHDKEKHQPIQSLRENDNDAAHFCYEEEKKNECNENDYVATSPFAAASSPSLINTASISAENGQSTTTTQPPPIEDVIRQEWIDAVFGKDFLLRSNNEADKIRQGVGLSGIRKYTTHQIEIPNQQCQSFSDGVNDNKSRIGMTMSRLTLGLYVQHVAPDSEARWAGVRANSVLVSINGMAMLAEPSVLALERIWQYEGIFQHHQQDEGDPTLPTSSQGVRRSGASSKNDVPSAAVSVPENNLTMREPVALKFIEGGEMYTVVFLSNPPWGIQWAPCGNFCLVKRVCSTAAVVGVKPGAIVAAVNETNLRKSDCAAMALDIRHLWQEGKDITVTLAFTPEAARCGYFERRLLWQQQQDEKEHPSSRDNGDSGSRQLRKSQRGQRRRNLLTKTMDGVQVRFHPLESAIGGLMYQAGIGPSQQNASYEEQLIIEYGDCRERMSLHELAERVAAGNMPPPTGTSSSMPSSSFTVIAKTVKITSKPRIRKFIPCPVLSPDELMDAWDPVQGLLYCLYAAHARYEEDTFLSLHHAQPLSSSPMMTLRQLMTGPGATNIARCFLLQFLSLICTPEYYYRQQGEERGERNSGCNNDKVEQGSYAKELTLLLLNLSRHNDDFCRYLYYILRSYISTFEERPTSNSKPTDNSQHLTALLHCLDLLRFAEKQLSKQNRKTVEETVSGSLKVRYDSTNVSQSYTKHSPPSPAQQPPILVTDQEQPLDKKKKRAFRFLKKKSASNPTRRTSPFSRHHKQENSEKRPTPLSFCQNEARSIGRIATKRGGNKKSHNLVSASSSTRQTNAYPYQSPEIMYENMSQFLSDLDQICCTIERTLQKTVRQKIAEWTMQPWSDSKDTALAQVTNQLRDSLRKRQEDKQQPNNASEEKLIRNVPLLVNPVESSELLSSVDYDECYILPSAHFPILLTFNVSEQRSCPDTFHSGGERLYRTTVELMFLRGSLSDTTDLTIASSVVVHGAVAGTIVKSRKSQVRALNNKLSSSSLPLTQEYAWNHKDNRMQFQTRSSWGAPQTLTLRLSSHTSNSSSMDSKTASSDEGEDEEIGYCWVDLSDHWKEFEERTTQHSKICQAKVLSLDTTDGTFDEQGFLDCYPSSPNASQDLELFFKVTTESVDFKDGHNRVDDDSSMHSSCSRKRMLLYKHDDDLRQEAFAVQFIRVCDSMLKASGLDMKLLTFQCIPVGMRRGFVEWVTGSVPLSEICQPFGTGALSSILKETKTKISSSAKGQESTNISFSSSPSMLTKAGLTKYKSLRRLGGHQNESFRPERKHKTCARGTIFNNPIQDYLRSVAYDASAPYLIKNSVMDTYVKSCAGYGVITYILGVGDRHMDNLLLHQSGSFFHCDYSFILGSDPKMYLPLRITEDMVHGFGGLESDNYDKFLSLSGAAFLTLRRPENARVLLNMVRLLQSSRLPDVSENQPCHQAVKLLRDRLRLDLTEQEAVAYMEQLIEASLSNKLWIAVDAIHSLGKKL